MDAKETNRRMTGNVLLTITSLVWGLAFVAQRVGMDSIGPVTFTPGCSTGYKLTTVEDWNFAGASCIRPRTPPDLS